MQPDPAQIARHRLLNTLQTLLVAAGLLAIPAWILAGGAGVVWGVCLGVLASHPDYTDRDRAALTHPDPEPVILQRPAGRTRWYLSGPWR